MFGATVSFAQNLQKLPQDPAIKSSVFPNGLSCYIVENKSSKGMADISLIRRDYSGEDLICTHKNIPLSSETAVDSVLLGVMRQVERDRIPADCAVVVCGDVDAGTVMTKLKYMSLMVDSSVASSAPEYTWDGNGKIAVSTETDTVTGLSTVRLAWQVPRLSAEIMNSTQAAIYNKIVWEMGHVACLWIKRELQQQSIPFADVSCRHENSVQGLCHERVTIDIVVLQPDAAAAQKTAELVLWALDNGRVCQNDVLLAEKEYLLALEKSAHRPVVANEEYAEVCKNAFLYNAPLSSDKERLDFFCSKSISDVSRKNFFSKIAAALIDIDVCQDSSFHAPTGVMLSDTLGFPGAAVKTKVKSSRKDMFSGGHVWTFANGVKVIYHKMKSTDHKLYYSLSLNGGYGNIEKLERGEGAYMSDYLQCCWVAGMKYSDFKAVLNLSGMTLDTKVKMYKTIFSGQVEDRNVSLLMKSLLAVFNESRTDASQVDYYSRCENLRRLQVGDSDVKASVDSLLSPGYRYSSFKTSEGVRQETFAKAETLFSFLTTKVNDGVLVLVGDMDESDLKKQLQNYVGAFRLRNVASRRPSIQYRPVSGWSSYDVEGGEDLTAVVISAPLVMTSINHFAAEITAMLFERRVKEEFLPKGIDVRMAYSRNIYPDERFSIMIELLGTSSQEDLIRLKDILSECQNSITEEDLCAYREYVKNSYALQTQTADYWLRVIPLRHLEGKDFTTGYDAKIDAVSLPVLQRIFSALNNGAGLEYRIIGNKD